MANHNFKFLVSEYSKSVSSIEYNERGQRTYYPHINQNSFTKIPGMPFGYWVSETYLKTFDFGQFIDDVLDVRQGLATGNNEEFVRYWQEVSLDKTSFVATSIPEAHASGMKWFPYNKGGGHRKWYGNQYYLLAFDKPNYEKLSLQGNHLPSRQYYFRECITWSDISSGSFALIASTSSWSTSNLSVERLLIR